MGELLCQASAAGIQILIETHSDHVLNGIRLAVHARKAVPATWRCITAGGCRGQVAGVDSVDPGRRRQTGGVARGFLRRDRAESGPASGRVNEMETYLVFNDLSVAATAPDEASARQRLDVLAEILVDPRIGGTKVLVTPPAFLQLPVSEGYAIGRWAAKDYKPADREKRVRVKTLMDRRKSYAECDEEGLLWSSEVEYRCGGETARGLATAFLVDGLAVSLSSGERWDAARIRIEKSWVEATTLRLTTSLWRTPAGPGTWRSMASGCGESVFQRRRTAWSYGTRGSGFSPAWISAIPRESRSKASRTERSSTQLRAVLKSCRTFVSRGTRHISTYMRFRRQPPRASPRCSSTARKGRSFVRMARNVFSSGT